MIISCLYYPDIFMNAQRVSRFWRDTIAQSPKIQRTLRLRPDADRVISPLGFLHDHTWPSLAAALLIPKPFAPDLPVYPSNLQESYLTRERHGLGHVWRREGSYPRATCLTLSIANRSLMQARSADFQPTWFGWFLTEPRITVTWLELVLAGAIDKEGIGSCYYSWSCASVRDPNGLTFGSVLRTAEKIRQSAPVGTKGRENARALIRFVTEPWERREKSADIADIDIRSGRDNDPDA